MAAITPMGAYGLTPDDSIGDIPYTYRNRFPLGHLSGEALRRGEGEVLPEHAADPTRIGEAARYIGADGLGAFADRIGPSIVNADKNFGAPVRDVAAELTGLPGASRAGTHIAEGLDTGDWKEAALGVGEGALAALPGIGAAGRGAGALASLVPSARTMAGAGFGLMAPATAASAAELAHSGAEKFAANADAYAERHPTVARAMGKLNAARSARDALSVDAGMSPEVKALSDQIQSATAAHQAMITNPKTGPQAIREAGANHAANMQRLQAQLEAAQGRSAATRGQNLEGLKSAHDGYVSAAEEELARAQASAKDEYRAVAPFAERHPTANAAMTYGPFAIGATLGLSGGLLGRANASKSIDEALMTSRAANRARTMGDGETFAIKQADLRSRLGDIDHGQGAFAGTAKPLIAGTALGLEPRIASDLIDLKSLPEGSKGHDEAQARLSDPGEWGKTMAIAGLGGMTAAGAYKLPGIMSPVRTDALGPARALAAAEGAGMGGPRQSLSYTQAHAPITRSFMSPDLAAMSETLKSNPQKFGQSLEQWRTQVTQPESIKAIQEAYRQAGISEPSIVNLQRKVHKIIDDMQTMHRLGVNPTVPENAAAVFSSRGLQPIKPDQGYIPEPVPYQRPRGR